MRNVASFLIIALLVSIPSALLFAESSQTAPSQAYPERWTSAVEIKNQKEIEQALERTVDMSKSGGSLECFRDADTGELRPCKTCTEYFRWLADGNSPQNTYQITMESWFKDACFPLKFLKQATPSIRSFIAELDFQKANEPDLAPLIQIVADESGPRKVTREKNAITLESEDDVISIEQQAWGDFNQDGTEDCLMYLSYVVTQGTLRYYTHVVVTKLSSDGKLEILTELK